MKKNKLTKQDIVKNVTAVREEDMLSPEIMQMLEDKLPAEIKEYAADGTAIYRWNYEHLIIIEYLLREHFGFSESQLEKLERELKHILPKVVGMKMETPIFFQKSDYVGVADKMVELNKQLFKREQSHIALPEKKKLIK